MEEEINALVGNDKDGVEEDGEGKDDNEVFDFEAYLDDGEDGNGGGTQEKKRTAIDGEGFWRELEESNLGDRFNVIAKQFRRPVVG